MEMLAMIFKLCICVSLWKSFPYLLMAQLTECHTVQQWAGDSYREDRRLVL